MFYKKSLDQEWFNNKGTAQSRQAAKIEIDPIIISPG